MDGKQSKVNLLFQIFITFFKIAPITFGGGYAMIPLMEREIVERRKWMTTKEIASIFAISESIPGAIAINSSTFIGYRLAGPIGAVVAMTGLLLPTFCIVLLLSISFLNMQHHPKIEAAFISIRATIVALIVYAAYKIGQTALIDRTTLVLMIITIVAMLMFHVHPVVILIVGSLLGIGAIWFKVKLGRKVKLDRDEASSFPGNYDDLGGGI